MKRIALAALATAAALTLTACSTAPQSTTEDLLPLPSISTDHGLVIDGEEIADAELYAAAQDQSVSLVSGMSYEAEQLTVERFTRETGIEVEFTRMPSNKLLERVLSEAGAGRLSVDVIRTTDMKAATTLADNDVLVPYTTPNQEQLNSDGVVFGDGKFVSSFYSLYSFAFNNRVLTDGQVPVNWEDLLDESLRERIGLVQVGAGSYNLALMDFLIRTFGEDYLADMGKLSPRVYDSASVQIEALTRGEIAVATLGLNNGVALARSGAPVTMVLPAAGASGAYTPLGLTSRGLDNPAARVFMNWQMSKSGQRFAAAQGFVPSRSDLGELDSNGYALPGPDDPTFQVFTPEDQAARQKDVVAVWKDAFNYNS